MQALIILTSTFGFTFGSIAFCNILDSLESRRAARFYRHMI